MLIWRCKVRQVKWVTISQPNWNNYWQVFVHSFAMSCWNTAPLWFTSFARFWSISLFYLSNCWQLTTILIIWFLGKSSKCTTPSKSYHTYSMTFFWWMFALDMEVVYCSVYNSLQNTFLVISDYHGAMNREERTYP